MRMTLVMMCALGSLLGSSARAADPTPAPTPAPAPAPAPTPAPTPAPAPAPAPGSPQTHPPKDDDAWILDGWTAAIAGIGGGDAKTQLVVNGEEGYRAIIDLEGQIVEKAHPAVFDLEAKDYRISLKVIDTRGATWSEMVDVPKSMKITVDIKAMYQHRGYEGTIKNDTLGCKKLAQRKKLKFEIYQAGAQLGNFILLEPGKSAPGVRLKIGTYDLKVYDQAGADWNLRRTAPLDIKEPAWRFDEGCE